MADKATFADLHRLLGGFGFVQTPVKGSHMLFEHKPSDTLFMFRPHRLNERIDPVTLSVVRKMLDEKGLLERDEFDSALREASENGKTRVRRK